MEHSYAIRGLFYNGVRQENQFNFTFLNIFLNIVSFQLDTFTHVIFLEMLIFLDIWTKQFFQKDFKKSTFCLNFDIFAIWPQKDFFESDPKKNSIFLEIMIFRTYMVDFLCSPWDRG